MGGSEGPPGGPGPRSADVPESLRQSPRPGFIMTPVRNRSGTIVELTYAFINDAAQGLYGMTSNDVVGHGLLELFPSSRENGIFDANVEAIRTQDRVDLEVPWVDENGVQGAFTQRAVPHGDGVMITAVDVTAMKLEESEQRYRLLAEAASDVVYTHGMDGVVEWVSPSVTEVLGWRREDFVGISLRDLVHPDDLLALAPVQESILESGAATGRAEVRFATVDGRWRWMSVATRMTSDNEGRVTGAVEALRDIQPEVEAREALGAQAERLELVLEGSGLGMWDIDVTSGSGVWDERCVEIIGYSLANFHPVTMEKWVARTHPDDAHRADLASEAHLAGLTASLDTEVRLRHRDGNWVWGRVRGRVVERSDEGLPLRMTGTLEDTTAQVAARQALERSEHTLQTTQRMARLGSWTWDVATDHVVWSDPLYELFGLEPTDPAPHFAEQAKLYSAESWEQLGAAVAETSTTGIPYDLEIEVVLADAMPGWVRVRGQAVRDGGGHIVGLRGYVLDITERKRVEEALASSEALFRTAMLSSPIGLAMADMDGSFRVVNESLRELLGRDEQWLVTHTEQDVMHPDDLGLVVGERTVGVARDDGADGDAEMSLVRYIRADGHTLWVKRAAALITGTSDYADYLLIQYSDATAEHEALEALAYQAFHDPLTGLRNRAWILDMLEVDLRAAPRVKSRVGVLFLDLDNFKTVNDSLGHAAGDEVLKTVADRIASVLRPRDRVGRSGGDEFIVVLPNTMNAKQAEVVAQRILSAVGTELTIRGHRIVPTLSIGIALSDHDSTSANLLRDADAALFRAKNGGRARYRFFDNAMHAQALARLTIEREIRRSLDEAEFVVHYQPIVTLADRSVAGYEALVRWQHPTRGLLSPTRFLTIAEDSGLIVDIGQQVLDQVCGLLAARPDLPGPISVNLSTAQLSRPHWLKMFIDTLSRHGIDPGRLNIDLAEITALALQGAAETDLMALRDLGVSIHLDDFGTGSSTISPLRDLPVTGLKLDGSFVADLSEDDDKANALSAGLAGLVNGLHLMGIAEGVETEAQHRILLEQGWSHAQGYLFARPCPEPVLTIPGPSA